MLAFYSTADIGSTEAQADRGNGELYAANFNGTTVSNLRQLTRTPNSTVGDIVNILSPGRRLSRNGHPRVYSTLLHSNARSRRARRQLRHVLRPRAEAPSLSSQAAPPRAFVAVLRFPTFTGDSANLGFISTPTCAPHGEALAEDSPTD